MNQPNVEFAVGEFKTGTILTYAKRKKDGEWILIAHGTLLGPLTLVHKVLEDFEAPPYRHFQILVPQEGDSRARTVEISA